MNIRKSVTPFRMANGSSVWFAKSQIVGINDENKNIMTLSAASYRAGPMIQTEDFWLL